MKPCRKVPKSHEFDHIFWLKEIPCPLAQSITCLTADLGVGSLILAQFHTFVKIDHEITCLTADLGFGSLILAQFHTFEFPNYPKNCRF